jgi:hypothetical protein
MSSAVFSPCWICGDPAVSGEHMTKRSDLRSAFGKVTQDNPLYRHDAPRRNRRVGSIDAKLLKSPGRICEYCNSTRTQPYDRAWERLSIALRTMVRSGQLGKFVRTNRVFPYDTGRRMHDVHLYFVKLFGCHIAGNNIPLDLKGFSSAILTPAAHPNVYLSFGYGRAFADLPMTGMSDMWLAPSSTDRPSTFATWFYDIEGIGVNVMFAAEGEKRQGLVGAWHPKHGTTKLHITNYSVDANAP